ncbi:MAG: hypothetical protein ACE5GY_00530 [Thermodesulfobacteriota bacterium]
MADLFMLILSLAVFVLAGGFLLRAARPRSCFGVPARTGLCFLLGLGAVSLQMFLYSLISIPFGFLVVALPWAALYGLTYLPVFRTPAREDRAPAAKGLLKEAGWPGVILIVIIVSQAAYALLYAGLLPVRGWDAWLIWFFKARAFFADGGVTSGFLLNPDYAYSHPDYPLLVPLSVAWVYTALGHAGEMAAEMLYPLQFIAMLLVFHWGARRAAGGATALLFTALLSLTPILLVHAAGFVSSIGPLAGGDYVGYADLTLALCFLFAGVFLYLGMTEADTGQILLSALFLALGAWTKNEGLPFAAFGFLLIAAHLAARKDWMRIEATACVLAVFIVPWAAYKANLALGSEFSGRFNPRTFLANAGRLGFVVRTMLGYIFLQTGLFSFAGWALAASTALNWRGLRSRALLALYAMVLFQLSLYAFVYVITPFDVNWHVRTSLDRLLLHVIPLFMFITAVNIGAFLRSKGPGAGARERS